MAAKEDGLSAYANGLPNEARARYMQKLNSIKVYKGLTDPYNLKCGWMSDPSIWPDLTFADIYCYLVDTPPIYFAERMKSFKSLDAYSYVVSGHVKEVYYHCIEEDSPVCFLSAKVTPSQRMKEKPHDPWVFLRKKEATVQCAHCTCIDAAENDNVATYCICDQQEYGKMIQCDNDECSFQRFHYACVNVRRKPRGKWYCPRCKDN